MAYVNKQNLSDFWTNAKRYIAARDADQCDWTSIPVNAPFYQFEAEPRTPVNPVIEFGFTEIPPEEGEKSPSNPSTITGVDSITVTRCGKNLIQLSKYANPVGTTSANGVSFTVKDTGEVVLNGTSTAQTTYSIIIYSDPLKLSGGHRYVSTGVNDDTYGEDLVLNIYSYLTVSPSSGGLNLCNVKGSPVTFELTEDRLIVVALVIASGQTFNNYVVKPQIQFESASVSYEPPSISTATINLGETQYGGTLNVATGVMTVTHNKFTIDENCVYSYYANSGHNSETHAYVVVTIPSLPVSSVQYSKSRSSCDLFSFSNSAILGNSSIAVTTSDTQYVASKQVGFIILRSTLGVSSSATKEEIDSAALAWFTAHPATFVMAFSNSSFFSTVQLDPVQLTSLLNTSHVNTIFTDTGTIAQLTYAKPMLTEDDVFRYANWHRTETAGVVTCHPVPESELHPVVNFSFTETPPASGDKGPSNPSTISGVSVVEVCHREKNLICYPTDNLTKTINGIKFTYNGDGSFTASGTVTASPVMYRFADASGNSARYSCLPAGTYTLSGSPNDGESVIRLVKSDGLVLKDNQGNDVYTVNNTPTTFTIDEPAYVFCMIRIGKSVNNVISNLTFAPQLEVGDAKTDLRPAVLLKQAVNLNGTYYGGSIDLKTGLMTVTWYGEYISTAYTVYEVNTNTITVGIETTKGHDGNIDNIQNFLVTDKFPSENGSADSEHCRFSGAPGVSRTVFNIYVNKSRFDVSGAADPSSPTTAEWLAAAKVWMKNNPVFACYKLFTPFTVQLTPQQIKALPALDKYSYRVNTLYTDADSIQVGYMKSPIKTEEEFNNAILALGGNL